MIDPLEACLAWFDAQPPEVQSTIAFFVDRRLYEHDFVDLAPPAPLDRLREWLKECEEKPINISIARLVIFRGLVDYSCASHFTTDGWQEITDTNFAVGQRAMAEGKMDIAAMAGDMLRKKEFREAMWKRAGRSWEELCSGPLSDKYLRKYEDRNLFE